MTMPKQKPGRSKQNYATPNEFIRAACHRLGISGFCFDLAADESNTVSQAYFTIEDNALIHEWGGNPGWLWLNPPYRRITPWVQKAQESGQKIAMLVPASVGANWWRDHVDGKAYVLMLNGRIPFMRDKPKWLFPKDCCLLLYGIDKVGYEVWSWRNDT